VELIGQADVLDWRGVSMVWGLTGFLDVAGKSAVRFANAHLIDDETVAKMGHPDGFRDVRPWSFGKNAEFKQVLMLSGGGLWCGAIARLLGRGSLPE
jgi:hypothetical protein